LKTTKSKTDKPGAFKCDQPECSFTTNFPQVLGSHKLRKHGIGATSQSSLRRRRKKEEALPSKPGNHDPHPCQHCRFVAKWKGGLTKHMKAAHPEVVASPTPKKEKALVKRTAKTIILNGHAPQSEDHSNANGIPDALIALATGRFQELCRSLAFEHDVPPRLFTARVAAFVYGSTVR
jgi:hypothetical protein